MPRFPNRFLILFLLVLLNSVTAGAWDREGHFQVGMLAFQRLEPVAESRLQEILGKDNVSGINKACNWPDRIRDTTDGRWSEPQHYINIPRNTSRYDRERDCPNGLCVTEAIKKYAAQLENPRLPEKKKWEAYAWLCHLVGDLHQPLHAGYRDDRGGNRVRVSYLGEYMDLHEFWDGALISEHMGPGGSWQKPQIPISTQADGTPWLPPEADAWTEESHRLVAESAYPPGEIIQPDFADSSWLLVRRQWLKAGERLARILNTVLGQSGHAP